MMAQTAPQPVATHEAKSLATTAVLVRAVIARVLRESSHSPDVEDAVQETMRRVLEAAVPSHVTLERYAVGVARFVALDVIRDRQKHRATFEDTSSDSLENRAASLTQASVRDGAQQLGSREELARLESAIEALPEGQRRAILLFHVEGLAYEAIAKRLEVPVGTVATWLMRAKTTLHRAMNKERLPESRT